MDMITHGSVWSSEMFGIRGWEAGIESVGMGIELALSHSCGAAFVQPGIAVVLV